MDAGVRANIGTVLDDDVSGQGRGVGHDYIVSKNTIMSDVNLGHHETIVASLGEAATACSSAMDRHKLSNAITPADFGFSSFARELQILRRQDNRNEWKDMCFISDPRAAIDHAMAVDTYSIT